MLIQAISIFPAMFNSITQDGVIGRAHDKGLWHLATINPRDFADNPLGYVDDRPFGGGAGMIMQAIPMQTSLDCAARESVGRHKLIYMTPQGKTLNHAKVLELAEYDTLTIICGRYDGIDERLLLNNNIEEVSIGDYVVSGGELPAMILMDAVIRHLPDVLGDENSAKQDSFANGLFDYPQYTRPAVFYGMSVPEVLLSGDHAKIAQWRLKESLRRTHVRRPELLDQRELSPQESRLMEEIHHELQDNSISEQEKT